MSLFLRILRPLSILVILGLSGCASAEKKEDDSQPLSTLPWNAPAQWEKSAPIGGGAQY